ncbi:MAG: hypothetical protein ACRDTA_01600 [Pseudonocardiaceae bacterium]
MTNTAHAPFMTLPSGTFAGQRRTAGPAVAVSTLDVALPLAERASILEAELTRELTRDAQLESHTATVAVVVYQGGQLNHVTRLLLTFMRLGLGLFVRAATVENTKSSRVMLTVDECGNTTRLVIPR